MCQSQKINTGNNEHFKIYMVYKKGEYTTKEWPLQADKSGVPYEQRYWQQGSNTKLFSPKKASSQGAFLFNTDGDIQASFTIIMVNKSSEEESDQMMMYINERN